MIVETQIRDEEGLKSLLKNNFWMHFSAFMLGSLGSILVLPYSKGSWKMLAATLGRMESLVTQITVILHSNLFLLSKENSQ